MIKRGQIAGQIFIYIMAAVVIGAIMLIGWKAINYTTAKTCSVERINFQGDIVGLIEKYDSYGAVNKKSIKAPCDYDAVCFVNSSSIGANTDIDCTNLIIRDSVRKNIRQDIFIISNGRTTSIGYSGLIGLGINSEECLCIHAARGSFTIKFEGKGAYTLVSQG